ncbi:MAG: FAD binding domain-containing protein [Gammaproteobacteria bacterium]
MHLPRFEYVRPDSVAHVLTLLGEWRARASILAGGTDLLASMGQRLAQPKVLIGIRYLPQLAGVEAAADGGLRIAAATTLSDLEHHPLLAERFPTLKKAINAVASRHVRNMATLGGNLALPTRCWYTNQTETWRNARSGCFKTDAQACHVLATSDHCVATSSADSVPALIAHGASVILASVRGQRTVPLADFYREDGANPTVLAPDELIIAIDVPPCADRTAFIKVTPREGIDFGLGTIAVAVAGSNRRVERARIIVNALGSHPMPLRAAEAVIREQGLTEASVEAAAVAARADLGEITNLWTPAGYKRRLVRALLRRALDDVRRQKRGPAPALPAPGLPVAGEVSHAV